MASFALQGVIEYSISLFFAKLVAYTFLFWLPYYLTFSREFLTLLASITTDRLRASPCIYTLVVLLHITLPSPHPP